MLARFGCCVLILVAVFSTVALAAPIDPNSNAMVTAEVAKQLDSSTKQIVDELKSYQDENFMMLDSRMQELMIDSRNKVVIGGIGAILVANALVALAMMHYWRKYSYQEYVRTMGGGVEQMPVQPQQTVGYNPRDTEALRAYQQPEWQPQTPGNYIASELGQGATSNVSDMNRWQTQPAYRGAWTSPVKTEKQSNLEFPAENRQEYAPEESVSDLSWLQLKPEGDGNE